MKKHSSVTHYSLLTKPTRLLVKSDLSHYIIDNDSFYINTLKILLMLEQDL